ncbi:hypothetical protein C7H83_06795 [Tetragenococcus halophilus]|uniref:Calcineurin-like phosphoesterase domain-containing protein n=1 Tax=Tetragenococcus halophilus TaxID=51669 RepID=A0A3G5FIK9_TETHA|nr:metallophosphoesterase [Tetragenococcus halophilus]AYW50186.1 hypothetical protein C7H83_06795 [Tetragenococcus halophilus]GBD63782.1 hypothetical protein TEHD23766T_1209 [Tetragenococcus halophilus subsp. flandriensis]
MIYHILDHQFNALTTIDTEASDGIVVTDDVHTVELVNGTMLNTLTMDIQKNTGPKIDDYDPNSPYETSLIRESCYIVFEDDNAENVCVYIREVGSETETTRPISAVDLGLELRNGNASQFENKHLQYIDYFVSRELYDTGWQIGVNELGTDIKRAVDTNGDQTPLARLQSICEAFDCEMTFSVELQNTKVVKKLINIYHEIGTDKTTKVMYSGVDVETMTKSVNIDDVITAIEDTRRYFNNLVYDDGRFYTLKGGSIVYDRVANAEYGTGHTSKERFSGWRTGYATSSSNFDIDNFNELRQILEERSQPKFSADVNFLFTDVDVAIGDYITFIDEEYNPALRVKARVTTKEIHRSNQAENTATIDNVKQLESLISSDLRARQQQQNKLDTQYSVKLIAENGTSFVDGEDKITTIQAHVFQDGREVTNQMTDKDLLWFKTDKDGNHDVLWEDRAKGTRVTISNDDIAETASIKCVVTRFTNHFVQAIYFLNGLRDIARKVLKLQTEDTITSIHISDTHYSTDTVIRDDLENYGRSDDHIKNAAELTRFVDIDYVLLNGDVHDGGTQSKDIAIANYKKAVSTLGLCDSPYFISWGNHCPNAWGDGRAAGILKKPLAYKNTSSGNAWHGKLKQALTHKEMYEIATRPSTIFDVVENPDDKMGYYYYDVPDKNTRIIVLNTQDIPHMLDENGYNKYNDISVYGYRQKQITWLYETLKATPTDTTVCIYQHVPFGERYGELDTYPYNYEMVDGIIHSFLTGGTYSRSYTANEDFKASISCDFEGRKGTLAFLAHGHMHWDRITVDEDGVHNYSIGCSVSRPKKDQGDRPLSELAEDLWDVVMLNPKTRHVDLLRFGKGEDRSFDY